MEIVFNKVNYKIFNKTVLERTVLNDINIRIEGNKITAFLGTSGSGKSSLVQLIKGIINPTSGTISIKKGKLLNNEIGLLFQNNDEQFIGNTLREELNLYGVKCDENQIESVLKELDLSIEYLDKDLSKMGSGELRKVALASIFIIDFKVIILDEPSIGLQSKSKKKLIKYLKRLKYKFDKTIIVVSHDSDFVYELADFVHVLDKGNIVYSGLKNKLFKDTNLLVKYGLEIPKLIEMVDIINKRKNVDLGYRNDINDLVKDIYRYAR